MNQANQLRGNVNHNITDFYWKRKSRPKTQSVSVYQFNTAPHTQQTSV